MGRAIEIVFPLHTVRCYPSHGICELTIRTQQQAVKFAKMIKHLESKAYRAVPCGVVQCDAIAAMIFAGEEVVLAPQPRTLHAMVGRSRSHAIGVQYTFCHVWKQ